jgi:hypothetical protein
MSFWRGASRRNPEDAYSTMPIRGVSAHAGRTALRPFAICQLLRLSGTAYTHHTTAEVKVRRVGSPLPILEVEAPGLAK